MRKFLIMQKIKKFNINYLTFYIKCFIFINVRLNETLNKSK